MTSRLPSGAGMCKEKSLKNDSQSQAARLACKGGPRHNCPVTKNKKSPMRPQSPKARFAAHTSARMDFLTCYGTVTPLPVSSSNRDVDFAVPLEALPAVLSIGGEADEEAACDDSF